MPHSVNLFLSQSASFLFILRQPVSLLYCRITLSAFIYAGTGITFRLQYSAFISRYLCLLLWHILTGALSPPDGKGIGILLCFHQASLAGSKWLFRRAWLPNLSTCTKAKRTRNKIYRAEVITWLILFSLNARHAFFPCHFPSPDEAWLASAWAPTLTFFAFIAFYMQMKKHAPKIMRHSDCTFLFAFSLSSFRPGCEASDDGQMMPRDIDIRHDGAILRWQLLFSELALIIWFRCKMMRIAISPMMILFTAVTYYFDMAQPQADM